MCKILINNSPACLGIRAIFVFVYVFSMLFGVGCSGVSVISDLKSKNAELETGVQKSIVGTWSRKTVNDDWQIIHIVPHASGVRGVFIDGMTLDEPKRAFGAIGFEGRIVVSNRVYVLARRIPCDETAPPAAWILISIEFSKDCKSFRVLVPDRYLFADAIESHRIKGVVKGKNELFTRMAVELTDSPENVADFLEHISKDGSFFDQDGEVFKKQILVESSK